MKVAIYGRAFTEAFHHGFNELSRELSRSNAELYVFEPFYHFIERELKLKLKVSRLFNNEKDLEGDIDFMFSIGGDGTFLETISYARNKNIPLVGINSGKMGFLADISKEQISGALEAIFNGKYYFEKRTLLKLDTVNNLFGNDNYALNECTLQKFESHSMITIHVWINEEFINSYWADGLIISTPTGSTAYSLSVGGPIVAPDSSNFIITPLAPHNLTVRPLVIPDHNILTLKVEGRSSSFMASLDFRSKPFNSSLEMKISRADFTIRILKLENHSFYSTLRNKLMWGIDKRN
jgi:NAD+ kinase